MNQIRLSELLSGKAFHWLDFFVRNIPNTRLESRVLPSTQCFLYLHYDTKSKTKLRYDQWPRVRFRPSPSLLKPGFRYSIFFTLSLNSSSVILPFATFFTPIVFDHDCPRLHHQRFCWQSAKKGQPRAIHTCLLNFNILR